MKTTKIILTALMCAIMPATVLAQNEVKDSTQTVAPTITDTAASVLAKAEQGDAEAQNLIALWYYEGTNIAQDYAQAVNWWIKSAKQNNVDAIAHLGDCYLAGNGVTADTVKAHQLYIRAIRSGHKTLLDTLCVRATNGDIASSLTVAQCYRNGYGTKRNQQEAARFYSMAAAKGNVEGMREAGILYMSLKQSKEADEWLKKAVDAGDTTASYYYGKMYFDGKIVQKDDAKAVRYLTVAANSGMAAAQYEMGNAYYRGEGVTKDLKQALDWHIKAALQGNWPASWGVACSYKNGEGVKASCSQAFHWYRTAAGNGYQNKIAKLLSGEEKGWENSPIVAYMKAVRLYNKKQYAQAAEAFKAMRKDKVEDSRVMEEVCHLYSDDIKTVEKSVKALQKFASDNDLAAFEVAKMQLTGIHMEKDAKAAVETVKRLVEAHYLPAISMMGDLYYEGLGVEKNIETAVKYYSLAETAHSLTATAAQRFALCYENGEGGVEKDFNHANKLHRYAATDPIEAFFVAIKMDKINSNRI
ncbi:MAG: sel1 repeat family protein [Bacteroidales bacterium]|nr:sel1 repeat family protein [Bacteroidales bacterium]